MLHIKLLFLIHVSLIYGYTILLDTVISYIYIIATWILCIQLYHVHTSLLHRFTGIQALIVFVFLLHRSLFMSHGLLLHEYSCILVTWLFPVSNIDISVTGHMRCWYAMCETKWHVDLSHGATSRILHISYFSFPVMLFHAINRAHVLLSCYMYYALFLFLIHCVVQI